MRDRLVQLTGPRHFIAGTHAGGDAGAASPIAREQTFFLQLGVRARDRIWRDAKVACKLAYGGQRIACAQVTALDELAELVHDLLKRCEIGIDGEENFRHDVE
jgi:hypothetical protein